MRLFKRQSPFRRYRRPEAAVCPECAYPIQSRDSRRCSECGTAYPGPWNTRLRWGRRRLPHERQRPYRRTWPIAWTQTVLLVTFCPCHAVGRACLPDRFLSTTLGALLNLLVAAVLFSFLSTRTVALTEDVGALVGLKAGNATATPQQGPSFASPIPSSRPTTLPARLRQRLLGQPSSPPRGQPDVIRHAKGWARCVGGWLFLFAMAVMLAMFVANLVCRHPAEFAGMVRWALLSTVIFVWFGVASLPVKLATYAGLVATATLTGTLAPSVESMLGTMTQYGYRIEALLFGTTAGWRWLWSDVAPAMWVILLGYVAVLMVGFARNPHAGRRRRRKTAVALFAYVLAWLVVAWLGPWWAQLIYVL